jgi:hypothetical protein
MKEKESGAFNERVLQAEICGMDRMKAAHFKEFHDKMFG